MTVGVLAGIPIGLRLGTSCGEWVAWLLVHVVLVAPTAVQPWVQWKAFKVLARGAVGLASGSYWVGVAVAAPLPEPRSLVAAGFGAVFLASAGLLLRIRSARPNDPCRDCPLGTFPVCEWNMPLLSEGMGHVLTGSRRLPVAGNAMRADGRSSAGLTR
jgi:hypothetical protein